MDNIYHQYWQQELMYQLASADRCRKRAYICSPFRADTREQREKNLRTARAYMFYANKKMNMNAAAPHAYLPLLLCDEIPAERAIALRFGLEILEQSDVMLVCGNKLSNGMRGEIAKAALLRLPITVFDEGLYLEVQKLVTQNNGNKKSVKLDRENFPMALRSPNPIWKMRHCSNKPAASQRTPEKQCFAAFSGVFCFPEQSERSNDIVMPI